MSRESTEVVGKVPRSSHVLKVKDRAAAAHKTYFRGHFHFVFAAISLSEFIYFFVFIIFSLGWGYWKHMTEFIFAIIHRYAVIGPANIFSLKITFFLCYSLEIWCILTHRKIDLIIKLHAFCGRRFIDTSLPIITAYPSLIILS